MTHAPGVVEEVAEELPDYLRPFPGPADADLLEEPVPPPPEATAPVPGKGRLEEEAFAFERDHVEEDQLLKVLTDLGLPEVEEQHDTKFKPMDAEMEEHYRHGDIPTRKDCPVCQQAN